MDVGHHLVGVGEAYDRQGGVVVLAVDVVVGCEQLVEGRKARHREVGRDERVDERLVVAEEEGGVGGVDGVVSLEIVAVAAAAVALPQGDAVVVLAVGVVVDVEVDNQQVEGSGVVGEGHGLADARHAWHGGVCGDGVVACVNAYGEAVLFLHGVVEEVSAAVDCGGTVVVAVD